MERLTYKQAYDKIIQAYFRDEIKPYEEQFCFCGTLNNNERGWWGSSHQKEDGIYYNASELQKMEVALLSELKRLIFPEDPNDIWCMFGGWEKRNKVMCDQNYEEALFAGMCAALEVLKQIHKDRGENVDDEIPFTKRTKESVPVNSLS